MCRSQKQRVGGRGRRRRRKRKKRGTIHVGDSDKKKEEEGEEHSSSLCSAVSSAASAPQRSVRRARHDRITAFHSLNAAVVQFKWLEPERNEQQ